MNVLWKEFNYTDILAYMVAYGTIYQSVNQSGWIRQYTPRHVHDLCVIIFGCGLVPADFPVPGKRPNSSE